MAVRHVRQAMLRVEEDQWNEWLCCSIVDCKSDCGGGWEGLAESMWKQGLRVQSCWYGVGTVIT